jgi:hypothetical protein
VITFLDPQGDRLLYVIEDEVLNVAIGVVEGCAVMLYPNWLL